MKATILLHVISLCAFTGWIFVWLLHLFAILNAKLKLYRKAISSLSLCSKACLPFSCHRRPSSEVVPYLTAAAATAEKPLPSVSIIKPLVGIDPCLPLNLESFFTMNYPAFELIFCIADEKDAVIKLVYDLISKYPHIPSKVFIGGCKVGTNPKINNMQPGYEAAQAELILISDSGIHMNQDTLLDMVSSMTEDIALVHQLPYTMDRSGFPAILEKVYFGTAHARIYLAADLLGVNCPTGMSALMRKSILDEVGGIKAFGQYLAEDFFFAKSFTDRGWQIRISSQPAMQNSSLVDVESFHNRISRWAKLRIAMLPHLIILEPLSECLLLGVIAAWSLNYLFSLDPFSVYLFHVLLWFMLDFCLLSIIQQSSLPFSKTDFVIAWFFRESTALLVFFKALLYPEIHWRTGTYKLKWGGIAEEVNSNKDKDITEWL